MAFDKYLKSREQVRAGYHLSQYLSSHDVKGALSILEGDRELFRLHTRDMAVILDWDITPEQFGLVLDKGSLLTTCVSAAVDALLEAADDVFHARDARPFDQHEVALGNFQARFELAGVLDFVHVDFGRATDGPESLRVVVQVIPSGCVLQGADHTDAEGRGRTRSSDAGHPAIAHHAATMIAAASACGAIVLSRGNPGWIFATKNLTVWLLPMELRRVAMM